MTGFRPDRMRQLREAHGWSQAELGRRSGVGQSTINRLESGETPNPRSVYVLAEALQTTAEYLMGRTDDSSVIGFRGSVQDFEELAALWAKPDADRVEIASVDLAYGMGGTFLDVGETEVERVPFSRSWLRTNVTDSPPEVLGVAQGIGDSMEPVLFDRDLVFFDRSARLDEHVSDKMWVFAYGQVGMIKRLRPLPDGTVKIMSANRTYPDEIAGDGELHIIGRVVASLRRH